MEDANNLSRSTLARQVLALVMNAPWLEILAQSWKVLQKFWSGLAEEGMYEVLEHESTLELKDKQGQHAIVHKRQKVRYLQNNILAYQDQAWGDGKILVNYRCTPGIPVDHYRPADKTYILISLREVKNRGDLDEFHIEWEMENGFRRPTELWAAEVSHRTRRLRVQVIFPKSRPPLRVSLVEELTKNVTSLGEDYQKQLPDGRWIVSWQTDRPRLYESYGLKWDW